MTVLRRAALVAVLALVLAPHAAPAEGPTASDLESQLVCPTCNSTLDQSDTPVARRMKAYIREQLAAGRSADEIKASLVAQFGDRVLAEPPKRGFDLLAWALPVAALAGGAVLAGVLAVAWSRRRGAAGQDAAAPVPALDPELERRVDEELARLDP